MLREHDLFLYRRTCLYGKATIYEGLADEFRCQFSLRLAQNHAGTVKWKSARRTLSRFFGRLSVIFPE